MKAIAIRTYAGGFAISIRGRDDVHVPWTVTPRLTDATKQQRNRGRLFGRGDGIHWPDLDEDLSVDGLVRDYGGK